MTNAEKFLKEGVDEEEFVNELHYFWWANEYDVCDGIRKFLHGQAKKKKPTLTEDERVILRNIKKFNVIGRDAAGFVYVSIEESPTYKSERTYLPFADLFQFIKERRRIRDKGVAER